MSLGEKIDKLKFDTRMMEIYIKNGTLKEDDVQRHNQTLPDSGTNAVNLDFKHEIGPQTREEQH